MCFFYSIVSLLCVCVFPDWCICVCAGMQLLCVCVLLSVLSPEGYRALSPIPSRLLWKQQKEAECKTVFWKGPLIDHGLVAVIIPCFTNVFHKLPSPHKMHCAFFSFLGPRNVANIQRDLTNGAECFGANGSLCNIITLVGVVQRCETCWACGKMLHPKSTRWFLREFIVLRCQRACVTL